MEGRVLADAVPAGVEAEVGRGEAVLRGGGEGALEVGQGLVSVAEDGVGAGDGFLGTRELPAVVGGIAHEGFGGALDGGAVAEDGLDVADAFDEAGVAVAGLLDGLEFSRIFSSAGRAVSLWPSRTWQKAMTMLPLRWACGSVSCWSCAWIQAMQPA